MKKTFTTTEIKDLLNQVYREEISFSRMVRVLNERVGEPKFKEGDFLHSDWEGENITIICGKIIGNQFYYHASKLSGNGLSFYKSCYWTDDVCFRLATESEKKELIDALSEVGKRWNAEKLCVEDIPAYKNGDFVVNKDNCILIFKNKTGRSIHDHAYLHKYDILIINGDTSESNIIRYATTEEKQRMIDALAKRGKRWNTEKKCIEDIPVRRFKKGDKVRIKDGISSKTNGIDFPRFNECMDKLIGTTMTVDNYDVWGSVLCDESGWVFREDWLEPYEELKKGDIAIFWDDNKDEAFIGEYNQFIEGVSFPHLDHRGYSWPNAIKFESKEQYKKLLKGEI